MDQRLTLLAWAGIGILMMLAPAVILIGGPLYMLFTYVKEHQEKEQAARLELAFRSGTWEFDEIGHIVERRV
mgnify:CR=1 FL=1